MADIRKMTDTLVGYEDLAAVLEAALLQAAQGKGRERHANDRPFKEQPLLLITRSLGLGFPLGQVIKKTMEADGMARRGAKLPAKYEMLGAIVYLAAAVVALDEDPSG